MTVPQLHRHSAVRAGIVMLAGPQNIQHKSVVQVAQRNVLFSSRPAWQAAEANMTNAATGDTHPDYS